MTSLVRGLLTPELLAKMAGHPVRTPASLLHEGAVYEGRGNKVEEKHQLLLAEQGADQPFAVAKWATGGAAERLRAEAKGLRLVAGSGDARLARTCPGILGPLDLEDDAVATVQTCLPGRSAYMQLRSSVWPYPLVPGHFESIARWLERFWTATALTPRPLDAQMLAEHVEQPLLDARSLLGADLLPDDLLNSTLHSARAHLGRSVRLVAEHGDLWVANLLVADHGGGDGQALGVIDWEYFSPRALPGFDPLLFCTAYATNFPWRPFGWLDLRAAFVRTYCERTWFSRHVVRLLANCCRAAELPRGMVPVMLVVTLARMAARAAEKGATDDGNHQWPLFLQEWTQHRAQSWLSHWSARGD